MPKNPSTLKLPVQDFEGRGLGYAPSTTLSFRIGINHNLLVNQNV